MISREKENLISRYDDPELSPSERKQLTELMETEEEARELEAQYRRLDAELETLPDGLEGVDFTGFRRRIRESIDSAPVIRMSRRRLWTHWAPIAAAASVAIAFLSIWQLFTTKTTPLQPPALEEGFTNKVMVKQLEAQPSQGVVNRIQLSAASRTVVAASFAVDRETDTVYDEGGVICFVGSESDTKGASVPSATGFLSSLLKGST